MKKETKTIPQKIERAKQLLRRRERMKVVYEELDDLAVALQRETKALAAAGLECKDNFEKKNKAFKRCGISRLELQFVKVPKSKVEPHKTKEAA